MPQQVIGPNKAFYSLKKGDLFCVKCKTDYKSSHGLIFEELKGRQFICSRCFYYAIMGVPMSLVPDWHEDYRPIVYSTGKN